MTTIAYKSGVMACDSCWAANDVQTTSLTKIVRLPSGALWGSAGEADDRAVVDLFKNVRSPEKFPSADQLAATKCDMDAILVLKNGQAFKVSVDHAEAGRYEAGIWPCNRGLISAGSGGELALGAMAAGATAREAVAVACNWDVNSRAPVHVMRLK